jgi:hypothetical protein
MLEALKTIGSLVGLATGAFVLVDRFLRHRPIAYFRPPKDDSDEMRLVVHNTASEAIVIDAIRCRPPTMVVSFSDDWRDLLDPDLENGCISIIAPHSEKSFPWVERPNWEKQKPEDRAQITIRWAFTSSRWLPLVPVRLRTTVGRLNQLRSATPPTA